MTDETITEWQAVIKAADAAGANGLWFEVYSPYLTKAFYFIAQAPSDFPMPEQSQNELMTVEIPLTIVEYKGLDTAIKPTEASTT